MIFVVMNMFSEKLRQKRKEKGLSQAELARRIGVGRDSYNKYERTGVRPSHETLVLLAKELNVSIDYLLGHTNKSCENNNKKTEEIPLTPQQKEVIASLSPAQRQEMIAFAEYLRSKQK